MSRGSKILAVVFLGGLCDLCGKKVNASVFHITFIALLLPTALRADELVAATMSVQSVRIQDALTARLGGEEIVDSEIANAALDSL